MLVKGHSSFFVMDELLNISERTVRPDSGIEDWSIEKLEHSLDLPVVSYIEGGITHQHPESDWTLSAGCQLLVLATLDTLPKLGSANKPNSKEL
jgi:hypothetical protein